MTFILLIPHITFPFPFLKPILLCKHAIFSLPFILLHIPMSGPKSYLHIQANMLYWAWPENEVLRMHAHDFPIPLILMRVNAQTLTCHKHLGTVVSKKQRFLTRTSSMVKIYQLYMSAFIRLNIRLSHFYFHYTTFKIERLHTMWLALATFK